MNQREHRLQSWAHKFIERVVLPPMFSCAIDAPFRRGAGGSAGFASRLEARGIVFGLPDHLIAQGDGQDIERVIWIEFKRGTGLTARQAGVHVQLRRTGFEVYTCDTIGDVLDALRLSGMRLHGNAQEIAREYAERLDAADMKADAAPKRSTAAKPKAKATPARLAKLRAMGIPV
jgi:hypothetical protein